MGTYSKAPASQAREEEGSSRVSSPACHPVCVTERVNWGGRSCHAVSGVAKGSGVVWGGGNQVRLHILSRYFSAGGRVADVFCIGPHGGYFGLLDQSLFQLLN